MTELMLVSFAGAVLCLDSHAVAQLMISRPLVCCTVVGLLMGDPASGLWIGVLLELIWLGKLPIGISIPSDITLPGVVATYLSVNLAAVGVAHPEVAAIVLALPFGFLSSLVDRFNREMVTRFSNLAEKRLSRGNDSILPKVIWLSLLFRLLTFFLTCFLVMWLLGKGVPHLGSLPSLYYEDALGALEWLIPAVGMAAVLRRFAARKRWLLVSGSFVCGLILIQSGIDGFILLLAVVLVGAVFLMRLRREDSA
jgi:PTS system mannose-specific IIC component